MNKEIVLTLKNITKTYGRGEAIVYALRNVNLNVHKGELLVILGTSGSGKSTMLNIMGGMTKPDAGEVICKDVNIAAADNKTLTFYRREKIGFVFQFYNLISDLTAIENVSIASSVASSAMAPEEALEYVGMKGKMNKYPSQLSGGEQQRIAIARAIVKRSEFLLCDEPTGALDLETGRMILSLIERLSRERGRTVVIVTHSSAIASMADRVLRLRDGSIADEYINENRISADKIEW